MKTTLLILILIIALRSTNLWAQCDTLYLKSDSSLVIIYSDKYNYVMSVYDKQKDLMLFDIPGWAANSRLIIKPNNTYHIAVERYLPERGKVDWHKYEIVRYVLWVNGDQHSFFKTYDYVNYPKLDTTAIGKIVSESKEILTNTHCIEYIESDSSYPFTMNNCAFVRNIGFLMLGILNGSEQCLNRFNEVYNKCTGGEGCEAYRGMQKTLSYTDYELYYRNSERRYFYLVKKK